MFVSGLLTNIDLLTFWQGCANFVNNTDGCVTCSRFGHGVICLFCPNEESFTFSFLYFEQHCFTVCP